MRSRLPILEPPLPTASRPLPTVAALDALWREVSARPLWASPNLWRYLKLRWQMRLRLVETRGMRWLPPKGKINDCSGCMDICCVGTRSTVLLRLRDIAALMDIGRTDLITQEKPQFEDHELQSRPALRRTVASRAWTLFPALRQTRWGACSALTDQGACSLYPHWPLSCAAFPYAVDIEANEVFYSRRCNAFWIRPDARGKAEAMAVAAAAAYNERVKDFVLLAYAPERLTELGLARFLRLDEPPTSERT